MDFNALDRQLTELEARYDEWNAPIHQAAKERAFKINRNGYTLQDYQREINEVEQREYAKYDPHKAIEGLLDELCADYWTATPEDRAAVRTLVERKKFMTSELFYYIRNVAAHLQTTGDAADLQKGLAAASIEDLSSDYRDSFIALAELFVSAERAGIDPLPYFAEAAARSSDQVPNGGPTPLSEVLTHFHDYAIVAERRRQP